MLKSAASTGNLAAARRGRPHSGLFGRRSECRRIPPDELLQPQRPLPRFPQHSPSSAAFKTHSTTIPQQASFKSLYRKRTGGAARHRPRASSRRFASDTALGTVEASLDTNSQTESACANAAALVVEDEDPLRSAAAKMLRKSSLSVLEAADGTAAMEAIRGNGPIDVLLLDVTLPGIPGREILAEAKRLRPAMRVIVMSA